MQGSSVLSQTKVYYYKTRMFFLQVINLIPLFTFAGSVVLPKKRGKNNPSFMYLRYLQDLTKIHHA